MSQYKESVDTDITGRVLYLEQRTKGLQGRISAIENRLSGCGGDDSFPEASTASDAEFVPAAGHIHYGRMSGEYCNGYEGAAPLLPPDSRDSGRQILTTRRLDATGLFAGGLLIGLGLLLYAGNIDIIKNPLLSLGCGLLLILFTVSRSLLS